MSRTLFEKVWESHVVLRGEGRPDLLYVDLHLVHEVTSPQAFEGLRLAGRGVRRPDLTVATMDHNVPTGDDTPVDPLSQQQLETLARNCAEFGVPIHATGSGSEGIVHVIGPELGLTQPGMTIVCGDSPHLHARRVRRARVRDRHLRGRARARDADAAAAQAAARCAFASRATLPPGVTAKDLVLAAIGELGVDGGVGPRGRVRGRGDRARSRWRGA